jgi:hypothetical protein
LQQVVISYKREDRELAAALAEELRNRGHVVWWDFDLRGGDDYRKRIKRAIDDSDRVIVLWSQNSITSEFVIDEAAEAKQQGKLLPVSVDGSEPPLGFRGRHTVQVRDIRADIDRIVSSLSHVESAGGATAPRFQKLARPFTRRRIAVAGLVVALPMLVAAIGLWVYEPAQSYHRTAYIIGNENYLHLEPRKDAIADAEKVQKELQRNGFVTIIRQDADHEGMKKIIDDFGDDIKRSGGTSLLFFIGKHARSADNVVLLPIDAGPDGNGIDTSLLEKETSSERDHDFDYNAWYAIYATADTGVTAGRAGSSFVDEFIHALKEGDIQRVVRKVNAAMEANDAVAPTGAICPSKKTTNTLNDVAKPVALGNPVRCSESGGDFRPKAVRTRHGGDMPPFSFDNPAGDQRSNAVKILVVDGFARSNP